MPNQAILYASLNPKDQVVLSLEKSDPSKKYVEIVLSVVPAKNGKYLRINGIDMSPNKNLIAAIEKGNLEEVRNSFITYRGSSIIVKNGVISSRRPKNPITKKDLLDQVKMHLLAEKYSDKDEVSQKMSAFELPENAEVRPITSISKSTLDQLRRGKVTPIGYATYNSVFGPEVIIYYGRGGPNLWAVHLSSSYSDGENFLNSLPSNEPFGKKLSLQKKFLLLSKELLVSVMNLNSHVSPTI